MTTLISTIFSNLDYSRPVTIADGIYWVGEADEKRDLYCNPYLIVDSGIAVLIDGGSRPDFPTVVRKVLQVGIKPHDISHLIYQHQDPDLCGSLSNLEDIIDNEELQVVSTESNLTYIRYYSDRSKTLAIEKSDDRLTLPSGRVLRFIRTPYAHAPGAFMTFDEQTGTLFSSDLFGSYNAERYNDRKWGLFLEIDEHCRTCDPSFPEVLKLKPETGRVRCEWAGICRFHQQNMPSAAALRYAMEQVRAVAPKMIAPQHGSIIYKEDDIELAVDRLAALKEVGIDGVLARKHAET